VVSRKVFASIGAISQFAGAELLGFPDEIGQYQTSEHVARHRDQADDVPSRPKRMVVPGKTNAPSVGRASFQARR
jgi:hypothetical protein